MNGVPLIFYLGLGLFMFTTGVVGVIIRRNPIVIFMCIELMLNAVNLTFLAFARYQPSVLVTNTDQLNASAMHGQMMVIFVMAVAAAEVAVGLGIIMAIFRLRDDIDIDELNLLRG
ncbi:MAG: NADH-quinone oxidoreductase subunit [Fimbriimonadaceae bacterium]|jgi:NADH-quinone oxidoreductase subunit K|nr:NADH-quinone oxidoreductase subunit [Fimbriimonadaceae bacterium]